MTDLNTPAAHSGETLVHLHFINPDTNDRSTYIGEAASQRLRQDPATFRRTLDVSIDLGAAIDLAWYAENYGDTEWMVHIEGPDDCITHKDEAATVPLTEKDARDLALAVNMTAVREREASEFAPFMHATVFHNGVPVADDAEDDPVDITEIRRRLVGKSNEYYDLRKPFHKAMRNEVRIEDIKAGACLAWEGLAFASLSLNTLAFILRVAEQDDPTMAQKLAQIIEAVMDDGGEVLEDANADLDEQASAATAEPANDEPECGAEYSKDDGPCNLNPGHGILHQNHNGARWQRSLGDRVTSPTGAVGSVVEIGPCRVSGCVGGVQFLPDGSTDTICYRVGDLQPIETNPAVAP